MQCRILPSVGVARLGNSEGQFCLAPTATGGLPFEADQYGNPQGPIVNFKDDSGQVRRQGQGFKIVQDNGDELTLESSNVKSIEWTVHLANKKAVWYQYSELEGNLLYGESNSYKNRKVELRNEKVVGDNKRQALIVDPGPRNITGVRQSIGFDKANVPGSYPATYPPQDVKHGSPILTLGELVTDDLGRLVVIGAFGNAGGSEPLTSYGGSITWHDDTADGPVYCTVTFNDGSADQHLQAWVVVGSPNLLVTLRTTSSPLVISSVGPRILPLYPHVSVSFPSMKFETPFCIVKS